MTLLLTFDFDPAAVTCVAHSADSAPTLTAVAVAATVTTAGTVHVAVLLLAASPAPNAGKYFFR